MDLEGWVRLRLVSGMKGDVREKEQRKSMDLTSVWLTDIRIPECLLSGTVSVPMFLFSLFFFSGRRADAGLNTPPPPVRETLLIKLPFPESSGELEVSVTF